MRFAGQQFNNSRYRPQDGGNPKYGEGSHAYGRGQALSSTGVLNTMTNFQEESGAMAPVKFPTFGEGQHQAESGSIAPFRAF